jgi:hypothetical protein
MTAAATHDHPQAATLALQARAMLTHGPVVQVAMQPAPLALGAPASCCGNPECDEAAAWRDYQALALATVTAEQFDLAQMRWKIANRACLLAQAERGMRTWANAAEHIARMNIEAQP